MTTFGTPDFALHIEKSSILSKYSPDKGKAWAPCFPLNKQDGVEKQSLVNISMPEQVPSISWHTCEEEETSKVQ